MSGCPWVGSGDAGLLLWGLWHLVSLGVAAEIPSHV